MVTRLDSFLRLELALSETQYALHEVIGALRENSTATSPILTNDSNSLEKHRRNGIIPHYDYEVNREQRQRGEALDQRYKELWIEERKLKAEYLDPKNATMHDSLLTELEAVHQEMTEILYEFDPPDIED